MGKSDKKVKSDRINALRKQYDAFLEDDKKRKERNEYILEKLDKMRYCTAMVQVRQKAPIYIDSRKVSLYNMPEQALDNSTGLTRVNLNMPRQRVDDTVLLQEISKKYILIPKLRPTYASDYTNKIKPNIDENADWKSKYDILDQLKSDEKEQDSSVQQETCGLEPNEKTISQKYCKENDISQNDEPLLEYKNELPVKLPPDDQIPSYELQHFTKNSTAIDANYLYDNPVDNSNININQNNDVVYSDTQMVYNENSVLNLTYENDTDTQNLIYDHHDFNNTANHQTNQDNMAYDQISSKDNEEYTQIQEDGPIDDKYALHINKPNDEIQINVDSKIPSILPSNENYLKTDNQNICNQEETILVTADSVNHEEFVPKEEENNNVVDTNYEAHLNQDGLENETTTTSDMVHEINNEVVPPGNEAMLLESNSEYPIETVNVQDFTPHDNVQLVDGVNINPEPHILVGNNDLTHHYDPAVEPENIVPGETYNIEQNVNYDYTEEGVNENYNTEYSPPTESYPQNEEYAYYEGAQPEQPYAEINENEEITQRYDQNYEQQYGTEYDQQVYQQQGYEQEYAQGYEQQGYTEPQQQYETVPQTLYENQDNLTPQYVEQQLDIEEGYDVENTGEATQESNVETPVEKQQIPTATDQEVKVQ